jgi:hypothetical protein
MLARASRTTRIVEVHMFFMATVDATASCSKVQRRCDMTNIRDETHWTFGTASESGMFDSFLSLRWQGQPIW